MGATEMNHHLSIHACPSLNHKDIQITNISWETKEVYLSQNRALPTLSHQFYLSPGLLRPQIVQIPFLTLLSIYNNHHHHHYFVISVSNYLFKKEQYTSCNTSHTMPITRNCIQLYNMQTKHQDWPYQLGPYCPDMNSPERNVQNISKHISIENIWKTVTLVVRERSWAGLFF